MKDKYLTIKNKILDKCGFINNIHLLKAAVVSIIMLLTFVIIYWHKGNNEFYVSMNDKLFIVACMLITGLLYLFELKIKLPIKLIGNLVIFICFPYYFYEKLERINIDFASYNENARNLNIILFFSLFLLLLAISCSTFFSITFSSFVLLIFYTTNYFVYHFRGSPLTFSDILSIKTAAGVAGNYQYPLKIEIVRLIFAFFVLSGIAKEFSYIKKKHYVRIAVLIVGLLVSVYSFRYVVSEDTLKVNEIETYPFVPVVSVESNGLLLHNAINFTNSRMKEPEGYSSKIVSSIIEKYEKSDSLSDATVTPNIILIMNESFSDLDYLNDVERSEESLDFFKSLSKNCVKGTLISSILGGNTPNSEFECLTGSSMAFLPSGYVAFQQSIDREIPSIVTTCKDLGYETDAVHLYDPSYFDRSRIYPLLGIDNFYSYGNIDENTVEHIRIFASDREHFLLLEKLFDKKQSPVFEYCVTIQNHGGYFFGMDDVKVTNIVSNYGDEYSTLLKITDEEFEQFIEYFKTIEEPTIVCMFGDHQPYLFEDFYEAIWKDKDYSELEKRYMQAKTPFVIWANYPIEEKEFDEISINYLGVTLMETAGLPMSGFQKMLLKYREEVPVICGIGTKDKNGNYTTDLKESEYYELIKEYEYLQYNLLHGNTNYDFYRVK